MDKIQFAPAIDLPLTLIVLAGFLLHFQSWARNKDVDTSVDLNALLPKARFRVILLLAATLGICWACNIAVWFLFAFLLGIGLAISLLFGSDVEGGAFLVTATVWNSGEERVRVDSVEVATRTGWYASSGETIESAASSGLQQWRFEVSVDEDAGASVPYFHYLPLYLLNP